MPGQEEGKQEENKNEDPDEEQKEGDVDEDTNWINNLDSYRDKMTGKLRFLVLC